MVLRPCFVYVTRVVPVSARLLFLSRRFLRRFPLVLVLARLMLSLRCPSAFLVWSRLMLFPRCRSVLLVWPRLILLPRCRRLTQLELVMYVVVLILEEFVVFLVQQQRLQVRVREPLQCSRSLSLGRHSRIRQQARLQVTVRESLDLACLRFHLLVHLGV